MASSSRNYALLFLGILLILIGGELRAVESFVLTPAATRVLANFSGPSAETPSGAMRQVLLDTAAPRKIIVPPPWIGWALLSIGIVVSAHALLEKLKAE